MSISSNSRPSLTPGANASTSPANQRTFVTMVAAGKPGKVAMTPFVRAQLPAAAKVLVIGEFDGTMSCQDLEEHMSRFDQPAISIRLDQLDGKDLDEKTKDLDSLVSELRDKAYIDSNTTIYIAIHGKLFKNDFYLSASENGFSIETDRLLDMLNRGKESPGSKGTIQFAVCRSKILHKKLKDYPHDFIFYSGSKPIYIIDSNEVLKKQIEFSFDQKNHHTQPLNVLENASRYIGSNLVLSGNGNLRHIKISEKIKNEKSLTDEQLFRHLIYKFGTGSFTSIIKLLKKFDLNVLLSKNPDLRELIAYAANSEKEAFEKVITLLLLGVDPNIIDVTGHTALHFACIEGDEELIKCLLQNGANPSIKNEDGKTARDLLIDEGFEDTALLIDDFCSGKCFPRYSQQSMMFALCRKPYREVVQVVTAGKKAWLNAKDAKGDSLLTHSIKRKEYEISEDLIRARANVNSTNKNGNTALHVACIANTPIGLIRLLRIHGADFNAKNHRGFTPLIFAARQGRVEHAKNLVRFTANVNAQSLRGNTALHFAVLRNDVDMVKTLLDLGADKNIKNSTGKTPLDRARNKGFSDISNLLTTYRSAAEPD